MVIEITISNMSFQTLHFALFVSVAVTMVFPTTKPDGAKLRNAKALIRGKMYRIDYIYKEASKYLDKVKNTYQMKVIAV